MTLSERARSWPVVALAVLALVLALRAGGLLTGFEYRASDARARLLQHEVESDIVVVGIDARSLADLRQWPWPRRYHARALERLAEAGPRQVFIDIDFSARTQSSEDEALAAALARFTDPPVVLPIFFQPADDASADLLHTRPLDSLARHARLAGVNFRPEVDSLTRRTASGWEIAGTQVPSAASLLAQAHALPPAPLSIDYSISPASFGFVSYVDLLAGRIDPKTLEGRTVMIGATAMELGDILAVPVYQALPGVVVQALAVQSMRLGVLQTLPAWLHVLLLLGLTAAGVAYFSRQGWRANLLALGIVLALLTALNLYAYSAHRLMLEVLPPALLLITLFFVATLRRLDRETVRALAYALGVRRREALLGSVIEASTDGILVVDPQGRIERVNEAGARLFACRRPEMIGAPLARFVPIFGTGRPGDALAELAGRVSEQHGSRPRGGGFPVEISVGRAEVSGEPLHTVIVRDVSERKAQERLLQHQATHDSLTGLPNRAALMSHLERLTARHREGERTALLMLDLCRFKEVNDTLGHRFGDEVLQEVAQRFGAVADASFVARLGGDEFTLVVDSIERGRDPTRVAAALHDALRTPIRTGGIAIDVGVSIGISIHPDDAADAATLLQRADVAMYLAKRRGTPWEFYDAASDRSSVRRLAMVSELRRAISTRELRLFYQPQVDFRSGRAAGIEALLRWEHPELGAVSPGEFMVLAESTDLIHPLTDYTLGEALAQARAWRASGFEPRIAVNLSARLLQDPEFPARLASLLATHDARASALELEITESAMMSDTERALSVLAEIHSLGVSLSIDDFGTGFSSLAYLRDLPVHALKLDKSFVTHLHERAEDRSIVHSTVRMAHELGLEVVAEGVETAWTAQFLAAAGYDYGQGYHYSRALPAAECRGWMLDWNARRECPAIAPGAGETAEHARRLAG